MDEWSVQAIHTLTPQRDAGHMFHRRRLQVLDSYEVLGQPVVTGSRLSYVPWIDQAVGPYTATRVPSGSATGLASVATALRATVVPELSAV